MRLAWWMVSGRYFARPERAVKRLRLFPSIGILGQLGIASPCMAVILLRRALLAKRGGGHDLAELRRLARHRAFIFHPSSPPTSRVVMAAAYTFSDKV